MHDDISGCLREPVREKAQRDLPIPTVTGEEGFRTRVCPVRLFGRGFQWSREVVRGGPRLNNRQINLFAIARI